MLEIIAGAVEKENREAAMEWGTSLWRDLQHIDPGNILAERYVSLDSPSEVPEQEPLSKIFGPNDREVLALKEKYDQEDIFDLAVPRLKDYL